MNVNNSIDSIVSSRPRESTKVRQWLSMAYSSPPEVINANNRSSIYIEDISIMADFSPAVTCDLSYCNLLELVAALTRRHAKSPGPPKEQSACPSLTKALPDSRYRLPTAPLQANPTRPESAPAMPRSRTVKAPRTSWTTRTSR